MDIPACNSPLPALSVILFLLLLSCPFVRLSTQFVCFNLEARYNKEKSFFCIEEKKSHALIFFIPPSNNKNDLFTAADSDKTRF